MDNKEKKTLQIYIEDWEKLKKQATDLRISIADLVNLILKEKEND
jgi:hypothetical protein